MGIINTRNFDFYVSLDIGVVSAVNEKRKFSQLGIRFGARKCYRETRMNATRYVEEVSEIRKVEQGEENSAQTNRKISQKENSTVTQNKFRQ